MKFKAFASSTVQLYLKQVESSTSREIWNHLYIPFNCSLFCEHGQHRCWLGVALRKITGNILKGILIS